MASARWASGTASESFPELRGAVASRVRRRASASSSSTRDAWAHATTGGPTRRHAGSTPAKDTRSPARKLIVRVHRQPIVHVLADAMVVFPPFPFGIDVNGHAAQMR